MPKVELHGGYTGVFTAATNSIIQNVIGTLRLHLHLGSCVMSEFGGSWSEQKLDCVSSYLKHYQLVLKNQGFETVYIDACCGDGSQKVKEPEDVMFNTEAREFMRGSAQRAVELESPFHRYHFIEKSKRSIKQLEKRLLELKPEFEDRMHFEQGDVNKMLPKVISKLNPRTNRAVVFADPYGMQVDWETIEAIARCPIIDFWYLVPTMGLNRMVTRSGEMQKSWSDRIDRFLGEQGWRERWYKREEVDDLFGRLEQVEKVVDVKLLEDDFQARLRQAFPYVSKERMQLKDGGRVLFSLMFACSNPSPKAFGAASRIANHLLKS